MCGVQSYCLKVKEMDDEEHTFNAMHEPLYRVETGNYEYRCDTIKLGILLLLSMVAFSLDYTTTVPLLIVDWC